MKTINELNQKLKSLTLQKQKFNNLGEASVIQFIRYKYICSQQMKTSIQLKKATSYKDEVNFWYDNLTRSWIENPAINCRKYSRLERKASYTRDLKLYRMGLSNKKPLPPLIQVLNKFLSPIFNHVNELFQDIKRTFKIKIFSEHSLFGKIHKKYKQFVSNTLPHKINKLAFDTAVIGIKGYRSLKSNYKYFRSVIKSKDSIRYISNIINQANMHVSCSSSTSQTIKTSKTLKNETSFREALRVPPIDNNTDRDTFKAHRTISSVQKNNKDVKMDSLDCEYQL